MLSSENIILKRSVHNETSLKEAYEFDDSLIDDDKLIINAKNYLKKHFTPNKKCFLSILLKKVPIINWLPTYNLKQDIVKDIFAGFTVGIIQIAPSINQIINFLLKLLFNYNFIN